MVRRIQTLRARTARARVVDLCRWGQANEPQIHYAQIRPMRSLARWANRQLPITADCSESTTGIYHAAGAPDPNGLGYNGSGFTGTMLSHLQHITKRSTRRGDLAIFGGGTGEHVVILMQGGLFHSDPLVFSHGFEGGPLILPLSQEARYHAGAPITFLRGIPLDL